MVRVVRMVRMPRLTWIRLIVVGRFFHPFKRRPARLRAADAHHSGRMSVRSHCGRIGRVLLDEVAAAGRGATQVLLLLLLLLLLRIVRMAQADHVGSEHTLLLLLSR